MDTEKGCTEEVKVIYKFEFAHEVEEEGSTVPGQREIGLYVRHCHMANSRVVQ